MIASILRPLSTSALGLSAALTLPAQAPKVIQGHIRDALGNPATTVHVEAWDQDGGIGGGDDFMGSDLTIDPDGSYQITFTKVGWDGPRSKRHTSWRPDIYVKVLDSSGVELVRSSVRSNWKLRESPLTIDLQVPVQSHEIGFSVPSHGFHFSNTFSWFALPYGLCGGMSRHAADLYVDNRPVPPDTVPPANGSSLWDTLYKKQVDSLEFGGGVHKILQWMALTDQDFIINGPFGTSWVVWRGIGKRTKQELPRIKELLQANIPVPLLLIRTTPEPWRNHQVLANGFRLTRPDGIEIHVYDPNEPDDDGVWLSVDLSDRQYNNIQARQYSTNHSTPFPGLRGFYVMPGPNHPANLQGLRPYTINPVIPDDVDNPGNGAFFDAGAGWYGDFDGDGYGDAFHYDALHSMSSLYSGTGERFLVTRDDANILPDLTSHVVAWKGHFLEPNKDAVLIYTPTDSSWWVWFVDPTTGGQRVELIGINYTIGNMLEDGQQFFHADFAGDGIDEILAHDPTTGAWTLLSLSNGTMTEQPAGTTTGLGGRTMPTNHFVGHFQPGDPHSQVLIAPASSALPWTLVAIDAQNRLVTTPIAHLTANMGDLTRDEVMFHEADFDGDGVTDLMFYDRTSQQWRLGRLVGSTMQWSLVATTTAMGPLHNENAVTTTGDFDGDGKGDVMVFQFAEPGFAPATWSLGRLSNHTLSFAQVYSQVDFIPEEEAMIVGRYVDPSRDSFGFHDPVSGSYRFWTMTPVGMLERTFYDVHTIGAGCPTPSLEVPVHSLAQQPQAGYPVTLELAKAAPNSVAICLVGFSSTSWAGHPLPLNLSLFGGPAHCSVQVSGDIIWTVVTNGSGHARVQLPLSNHTLGLGLRSQFGVLDASIPVPLPIVTSNALHMRVR